MSDAGLRDGADQNPKALATPRLLDPHCLPDPIKQMSALIGQAAITYHEKTGVTTSVGVN